MISTMLVVDLPTSVEKIQEAAEKNTTSLREMRERWEEQYQFVTKAYADYVQILHEHQERTNTCGPHCDSFVLHAPKVCVVCDEYAYDLQIARNLLRIAFTGNEPFSGERPCPAILLRALEHINLWSGNLPYQEES